MKKTIDELKTSFPEIDLEKQAVTKGGDRMYVTPLGTDLQALTVHGSNGQDTTVYATPTLSIYNYLADGSAELIGYEYMQNGTLQTLSNTGSPLYLTPSQFGALLDNSGDASYSSPNEIFNPAGSFDTNGFDAYGYNQDTGTIFNTQGYDSAGYDTNGFNSAGYNINGTLYNGDGFDTNGFDVNGFDTNGFNVLGYTSNGTLYNSNGYDTQGYNAQGYDFDGFDSSGNNVNGTLYDASGYNVSGYNANGFDTFGYNANGYDASGYNSLGYNASGYDSNGYNSWGYNVNDYNARGFTPWGSNINGTAYDDAGYDMNGFDSDGKNAGGFYYNANGFNAQNTTPNGARYNVLGFDARGYNINGFNAWGYTANGSLYNADGFNVDGLTADGSTVNAQGYNINGFNMSTGLSAYGTPYNNMGYDYNGYNAHGFDNRGYTADGYLYNDHGFDNAGKNINGTMYDDEGYDINDMNAQHYTRDQMNTEWGPYMTEDDFNNAIQNGQVPSSDYIANPYYWYTGTGLPYLYLGATDFDFSQWLQPDYQGPITPYNYQYISNSDIENALYLNPPGPGVSPELQFWAQYKAVYDQQSYTPPAGDPGLVGDDILQTLQDASMLNATSDITFTTPLTRDDINEAVANLLSSDHGGVWSADSEAITYFGSVEEEFQAGTAYLDSINGWGQNEFADSKASAVAAFNDSLIPPDSVASSSAAFAKERNMIIGAGLGIGTDPGLDFTNGFGWGVGGNTTEGGTIYYVTSDGLVVKTIKDPSITGTHYYEVTLNSTDTDAPADEISQDDALGLILQNSIGYLFSDSAEATDTTTNPHPNYISFVDDNGLVNYSYDNGATWIIARWGDSGSPEYSTDEGATWVAHVRDLNVVNVTSSSQSDQSLGSISAWGEAGKGGKPNPGIVSSGKNDPGGVSYGTYQMATNKGTPASFLKSKEGKKYADQFAGLSPGSPDFSKIWKAIAANDPDGFQKDQFDYIKRTDYDVAVRLILKRTGFDVNDSSPALQQMIFSAAVQYGPGSGVFRNGLTGDLSNMSDAEIVNKFYDEKERKKDDGSLAYFPHTPIAGQPSLISRLQKERSLVLSKLGH